MRVARVDSPLRTLCGTLLLCAAIVATVFVWSLPSSQSIEAQASRNLAEIMAERAAELSKHHGQLCGLDVESLHEGRPVKTGLATSDVVPESLMTKAATDGAVQGTVSESHIRDSHVILVTDDFRSGGLSQEHTNIVTGAVLVRYASELDSTLRWEVFKSGSLYPCDGDGIPRAP